MQAKRASHPSQRDPGLRSAWCGLVYQTWRKEEKRFDGLFNHFSVCGGAGPAAIWHSMMHHLKSSLFGLFIALLAGPAFADASTITAMLDGRYTNLAQIAEAYAEGRGNAELDARFMEFRRVEAPAFGGHVVYLQWRRPDAGGAVTRQRLWSFHDREDGGITMKFYAILDGAALIDAHRTDPARFASLTPGEVTGYPESCDLPFAKTAEGWEGAIPAGCSITARSGREMSIRARITIEPDQVRYDEGGVMADGTVVFDVPQVLDRFVATRIPDPDDDRLPAAGP